MVKKKEKSLEELTEEAEKSWGKQLPQFIPLIDFETKIKRIARKYSGNDTLHQEGSHKAITIGQKRILWSPRQRGHEEVLSLGVFKKAVQDISEITGIQDIELELYFKGSGKPYRKYKKRFEEEYGL